MNDQTKQHESFALRLLGGVLGGALLGMISFLVMDVAFWAVVAVFRLINLVPLSPSGRVIQTEALTSAVLVAGAGLLTGAIGGMWRAWARD